MIFIKYEVIPKTQFSIGFFDGLSEEEGHWRENGLILL